MSVGKFKLVSWVDKHGTKHTKCVKVKKGPFLPMAVGWGCRPCGVTGSAPEPPETPEPSRDGNLPGFKMPPRKAGAKIFSEEYLERKESPDWKGPIRERILERAKGCCEGEGCPDPRNPSHLEIHHLCYDRLWHELDSDLQALCPRCHDIADGKRKVEFELAAKARKDDSDFERWARRKWGEFGNIPDNARDIYDDEKDSEDE